MWVYGRFEIIEKEFDTYTAFYQCRSTVVSIVLSCAYFELLDVEEYRTLKSAVDKAVRSQATSEPTERPLSCTARSALHVQCSCRHAISHLYAYRLFCKIIQTTFCAALLVLCRLFVDL